MIIRMAKIFGMYFVFEISFSKSIFDITRPNTNKVNPKPRQYMKILKAAYAASLELTSNAIKEIRYVP